MYVYNPLNLVVLKTKFNMTNEDICSVTGLKSVNSVTKRINGSIPLTAHEIAVLCNHTQKVAEKHPSLKPHIYTPIDFFDKFEE